MAIKRQEQFQLPGPTSPRLYETVRSPANKQAIQLLQTLLPEDTLSVANEVRIPNQPVPQPLAWKPDDDLQLIAALSAMQNDKHNAIDKPRTWIISKKALQI